MKTHDFDGVSFFSGVVVAAIGLLFLIPDTPSDVIDAMSRLGTWFWPLIFVVVGLAVIIPVLAPRKAKAEETAEIDVSGRLGGNSAGAVESSERDEEN
jgi:hypothetical protein